MARCRHLYDSFLVFSNVSTCNFIQVSSNDKTGGGGGGGGGGGDCTGQLNFEVRYF